MNKNQTVVLRAPAAQKSGSKMENAGVGFIDSVKMKDAETESVGQRTVIHLLPSQPLTKGKTIMIFPARGRELPDSIVAHAAVGDRNPSHVLYHDEEPVGSAWLHEGRRTKFLVVKINRQIDPDAQDSRNGKRFTLFPRFPSEKAAQ